jgi:VWFA-related protein
MTGRMSLRIVALLLVSVGAIGQEVRLKSTARIVLAPVAVTDRKGQYVRDLNLDDLVLYDNNVQRKIHVEEEFIPVSLVVAVQATQNSWEVLNKLHRETGLFGPILTGERGEAAVIGFAEEVKVLQAFTSDADLVAGALKNIVPMGGGGSAIDAVIAGTDLLAAREGPRRRVILLIGEKHDRSSKGKMEEAISRAQRANITVYPVTFSPSASVFTSHAPDYCDRKCRNCARTCKNCANNCEREPGTKSAHQTAPEAAPMNLIAVFSELKQLSQTNIAEAFAKYTGGKEESFAKQSGMEKALERIGEDLHGQYLVSFEPGEIQSGEFRPIRVEVKGRPELVVRTRRGYWAE